MAILNDVHVAGADHRAQIEMAVGLIREVAAKLQAEINLAEFFRYAESRREVNLGQGALELVRRYQENG